MSDWIVGVMMSLFGLVGLLLAARAHDNEMTVFGYSLLAFAICFVTGLVRRHYDERDQLLRAAAQHV